MEEKDQKTLTINDIIDQLAKPSILQGANETQPINKPTPPRDNPPSASPPPALAPNPPSGDTRKSEFSLPPLSKAEEKPPASSVLPPMPPRTEAQSLPGIKLSLRTMADDLAMLRSGQSSSGIEIKKTLEPSSLDLPKPPESLDVPPPPDSFNSPPVPPEIPQLPQLPPMPPLGKKEPAFSLPDVKIKEEFSIPFPEENQITDDNLPAFPGMLIPKKPKAPPVEEKVEYRAIARVISKGMVAGIIATIAVAIGIYFVLATWVFNVEEAPIITATPTPLEVSKTPEPDELKAIFGATATLDFRSSQDGSSVNGFKALTQNTPITKKEIKRINVLSAAGGAMNFSEVLGALSITYPAGLTNLINNSNYMVLLYGQDEQFNDQGPILSELPARKLVLIVEIKDEASSLEFLKSWEPSMPANFREIFSLDLARQASQNFIDNEHRAVKIRYKNFPTPDKSLDYTIITSLTGKHYLLISNSRESMYFPSERIQGI